MLRISFIFSLKMIFSTEEEQLHEQPYLISYSSSLPVALRKLCLRKSKEQTV